MYKKLFELNPLPMFSFTSEGKILETNESGVELLSNWNESVETLSENNLRVLIFKNTLGLQNVEILAGNAYYTFEVISIEDGVLCFYGADVTYQKNNAETLFSMIDDIHEGMILLDTDNDGQFVEVNYTITKMLGYSREEFLSLKLKDVSPDFENTDDKFWQDQVSDLKSQKKGEIKTITLRHKKGELFTVELINSIRNVMEKDYLLSLIRQK